MQTTRLYAGNFPDVGDAEIREFLGRIGQVEELVIKCKLNQKFAFFTTQKPLAFIKQNGKKLNGQRVLITNAKKQEFNDDSIKTLQDELRKEKVPIPIELRMFIDVKQAIAGERVFENDEFDEAAQQYYQNIRFEDIPRRFFEPTEFKVVERKRRPAAMMRK